MFTNDDIKPILQTTTTRNKFQMFCPNGSVTAKRPKGQGERRGNLHGAYAAVLHSINASTEAACFLKSITTHRFRII
jgi:hypothetical protein